MMRVLAFKLVIIVAIVFSIGISKVYAKDTLRFIETTGRAVIENDELLDASRRRALEDALYLAALHGGAKINGFSSVNTDTSIEESLVIQPASQILDYTVISEERTETHFVIKVRSAVGHLKGKECQNKGLKSLSLYKPIIEIDPKAPFWVSALADQLIRTLSTSLKSEADINLTDYSDVSLDRNELTTINDDYDYISLTSGRERTNYGDYAAVFSLSISDSEKLAGFTKYNSLLITLKTEIFDGSSYTSALSKTKTFEALFSSSGPWRTINLLLKTDKNEIFDVISAKAEEHAEEVIGNLVCKKMNSVVAVKDGKIEVPLGKRHGIKLSSLAITKGEQTPFNILRVEKVLDNKSVLIPLNNSLEYSKFNGKTIQFLGNM